MILLHPGHAHASAPGAREWIGWWTWDPLVIAALAIAVALYARGAARLWAHAGTGHGLMRWNAAAYAAGVAAIAISLLSPLDRASDVLFSAHMVQHELLMVVAAPLIVLGRPLVAVPWALPRAWRVGLARASRRPALAGAWRVLTSPVVALVLHAAVRWIWHLPALFDAALDDERIHAFQHLTFFLTAVLFWWSLVHGRYGRVGYGVAVAFVFFTMLHSGLLAAMLSLADHPLYEHGVRTLGWGVDPLGDQQRAGLLMWIPVGVVMTAIGLGLLAAWLGHAARRVAASRHPGLVGGDEP
jgi:putative membrane protein